MSQDAGERLVAGRWTLHTPLRRARRGVTWRATEVATGRRLAVEQLRLPEGADPGGPGQAALWERIAAEARTAASLAAPALVPLEDVVVEDGVVYVAAELVDALTLDELVARHGPLPVRRVAQLGLELLDALEALHAAGLAHLDLRPANVLITPEGHARLAGAGLATLRTELRPESEHPTTPFLAPEQLRGDPAGPPADLWSLGAILTLTTEGEVSFAGEGEVPFAAGGEVPFAAAGEVPFAAGGEARFAAEGEVPVVADGSDATAILDRPLRPLGHAGSLAPTLHALLTKPPGGRPTIPETRRLPHPIAGRPHPMVPGPPQPTPVAPGTPQPSHPGDPGPPHPTHPVVPGVPHPTHPVVPGVPHPARTGPGPPEGERSRGQELVSAVVHSPLRRLRAARNALDPVVQRGLLIAGGSVLLALVSFAVAVAVAGDPLGPRSQAAAPTAATLPPTTLPPTTTTPPTTVAPWTTAAPVVPPGWSVHSDPATGYQVAFPASWQVASDGGPHTELRDLSSPTFLRIDTQQDPQADPMTLEQQANQAHAGEHGGYAPARLEPAQFKGLPAALLEFTYQDGETWHVLELGIRSPRHHVAMAIYARDRDWGTAWALFEAFKASFVPPPT